jgi:hypothetical protein
MNVIAIAGARDGAAVRPVSLVDFSEEGEKPRYGIMEGGKGRFFQGAGAFGRAMSAYRSQLARMGLSIVRTAAGEVAA